jgi:Fe-S-cluster containining protein
MTWYKDGLQFECTRCGNCCCNANYPDIDVGLYVSMKELIRLSNFLKKDVNWIMNTYCKRMPDGWTFRIPNGRCPFLNEHECSIHPARFVVCRVWPFLPYHMESKDRWDESAKLCPGLNRGKLYTEDEILGFVDWMERVRKTANYRY